MSRFIDSVDETVEARLLTDVPNLFGETQLEIRTRTGDVILCGTRLDLLRVLGAISNALCPDPFPEVTRSLVGTDQPSEGF